MVHLYEWLILNQVSSGGNNEKDKTIKKIRKIKKNIKNKRNEKSQNEGKAIFGRKKTAKSEGEEREREGKRFFSLIFKIYGNRTVGFHQSKRQSRSTHRELRVGTKILEFCQTPRGREFSYLGYF